MFWCISHERGLLVREENNGDAYTYCKGSSQRSPDYKLLPRFSCVHLYAGERRGVCCVLCSEGRNSDGLSRHRGDAFHIAFRFGRWFRVVAAETNAKL